MPKPDIFKPYVVLSSMSTAGMIHIHGGGGTNDLVFELGSGSPYQCAYNEAFKLAVTAQLPLWAGGHGNWQCLYNPDIAGTESKAAKEPS